MREELGKKIYLRLPALAAMAAAWWLAHRYTTSSSRLMNWISGDSRTELSEDVLGLLEFWLPILAAALVAYLSSTLAKRVRRRYLPAGETGERDSKSAR